MQHPDEGMIHTWLDGELSAEDAAALETHVAGCVQCAAAVAEARGLIAGSSRIVSSLDSVPAGVIPAARPARRAWYSTTQFRAAAALLLVAGTSFLVVKKNETNGDKIMAVAAPRVVMTDAVSSRSAAAAPSSTTESTKATSAPRPALAAGKAPAASNVPMSSNAAVAAAPAPATSEPRAEAAPLNRAATFGVSGGARQTALKSAAPQPVMKDSGAAAAAADESVAAGMTLRLIRTDSMRSSTQRVFETPNGIQLIMTESDQLAFSPSVAQSTSARELSVSPKAAVRAAPVVPLSKDQVKLSDYRTITWVDAATGHSYSLTGPLPPDQLEKFKELVIKLSH